MDLYMNYLLPSIELSVLLFDKIPLRCCQDCLNLMNKLNDSETNENENWENE